MYKLRKAPKRDLYWVVGPDGKKHSKDPIPKDRAEAQKRVLEAAMGTEAPKRGKGKGETIKVTNPMGSRKAEKAAREKAELEAYARKHEKELAELGISPNAPRSNVPHHSDELFKPVVADCFSGIGEACKALGEKLGLVKPRRGRGKKLKGGNLAEKIAALKEHVRAQYREGLGPEKSPGFVDVAMAELSFDNYKHMLNQQSKRLGSVRIPEEELETGYVRRINELAHAYAADMASKHLVRSQYPDPFKTSHPTRGDFELGTARTYPLLSDYGPTRTQLQYRRSHPMEYGPVPFVPRAEREAERAAKVYTLEEAIKQSQIARGQRINKERPEGPTPMGRAKRIINQERPTRDPSLFPEEGEFGPLSESDEEAEIPSIDTFGRRIDGQRGDTVKNVEEMFPLYDTTLAPTASLLKFHPKYRKKVVGRGVTEICDAIGNLFCMNKSEAAKALEREINELNAARTANNNPADAAMAAITRGARRSVAGTPRAPAPSRRTASTASVAPSAAEVGVAKTTSSTGARKVATGVGVNGKGKYRGGGQFTDAANRIFAETLASRPLNPSDHRRAENILDRAVKKLRTVRDRREKQGIVDQFKRDLRQFIFDENPAVRFVPAGESTTLLLDDITNGMEMTDLDNMYHQENPAYFSRAEIEQYNETRRQQGLPPQNPLTRAAPQSIQHYLAHVEGEPRPVARTVDTTRAYGPFTRYIFNPLKHLFVAPREEDVVPLRPGQTAESPNPLHGHGRGGSWFDIFRPSRVINEVTNPDSILRRRITDVSKGVRKGYSPSARKTLEAYGSWIIDMVIVRRVPVQAALHTAFELVTLGKWNAARAETNKDRLFHLSIVVRLRKGGGGAPAYVLMEKNEVVNIGPTKPRVDNAEEIRVQSPNVSLDTFLNKALEANPQRFFPYDAFQNNCQDFVMMVLGANGLLNNDVTAFVKQPIGDLLARVPGWTGPVANVITDAAGIANVALEGAGKGAFAAQLKREGISPSAYLKEARRRAKKHQYPSVEFATDGDHKLVATDKNGRATAFGKVGYGDHIIYYQLEAAGKVPAGTAAMKQSVFRKSHSKIKGDWKKDAYSANKLALRILW